MKLIYNNKKTIKEILQDTKSSILIPNNNDLLSKNILIQGNNLTAMQALLQKYNMQKRINLIYIDPPFSTNSIYRHGADRTSTVSSSLNDSIAYFDKLKDEDYIEFIRERIILAKELLSDYGSIYVHIDYKIGHYIKVIMDEIFGKKNFHNDIARIKCNPKNFNRKAYGNIKDLILFYTKTNKYIWNETKAPLSKDDIKRLFKKIDKNGRHYTTIPLHAPGETKNGVTGQMWRGMYPPKGRHWRSAPNILEKLDQDRLIEWSSKGVPRKIIYAEDQVRNGKKLQDIWEFKDSQYPSYPTEKNIDLLKLIISTSSNPGDLVMDFFCGSGTTLIASHELNRLWIGIDQSEQAIKIAKKRLDTFQSNLLINKPNYLFLRELNFDTPHS